MRVLLSFFFFNLLALHLPVSFAQASAGALCEALKSYPRMSEERLSFQSGKISPLCQPFLSHSRGELDRCGDSQKDPYVSSTKSNFTWSSRAEMAKKGRGNLYFDADLQPLLPKLLSRVEEIRSGASQLCCGDDQQCQAMMAKVEIEVCKPSEDPSVPDPCVFGGSFKMPGRGYDSIFKKILSVHTRPEDKSLRAIANRNLTPQRIKAAPEELLSGKIVLSSYVSRSQGIKSTEPVIVHEFGHACTVIKMQLSALEVEKESREKVLRAAEWLDKARSRCQADLELPEAYDDFWVSLGESRELSKCLSGLTKANQKNEMDRPCANLCPGHYLEESVGVAFSMLLGEVGGAPGAVFPNTCSHVRDGQHPMVTDVVECLAQHSPRFRAKLSRAYRCDQGPLLVSRESQTLLN